MSGTHGISTLVVTGGAGFIGSAVVRKLVTETDVMVINVDKLTYAGNLESVEPVSHSPRYHFEHLDICDAVGIRRVFERYHPDTIMHLAAESHVDRSIDGPGEFIHTNVFGTYTLLQEALRYWRGLRGAKQEAFRFHHVSTDEVYGSLGESGYFTEDTPYQPNSPYSASKAASDHLVRAWNHTYHLPVVTSNCSNNYGPYQFPEKLIPLMALRAVEGKPLPVYGKGYNIRDWLYVDDHAEALFKVLTRGRVGETYSIGGHEERTNLQVVQSICAILDELRPDSPHVPHESLITFVADRPGHDKRYAIDATKIQRELDWRPRETFESGLRKAVQWYLSNPVWCQRVSHGTYQRERLGLGVAP